MPFDNVSPQRSDKRRESVARAAGVSISEQTRKFPDSPLENPWILGQTITLCLYPQNFTS